MGHTTLSGVQKLLHLDCTYPYFQTWTECLEFDDGGVHVKAEVTHKWREETFRIIEPFLVEGNEYGVGFQPMLILLGISFAQRALEREAKGISSHEANIEIARLLYRRHAIYLENSQEIQAAQEEFASAFRSDLQELEVQCNKENECFLAARKVLRQELKCFQISPKDYQKKLRSLKDAAESASDNFRSLRNELDRELGDIQQTAIRKIQLKTSR